uniref:RIMS-binding protein 2 n=1 Tax=Cyprinus carpio TaxID=7962 RepID=A0A8C1KZM6_CYPCA
MREAAERRQQLELEHEQALAVLSAKQQEIDLLQKAQVEAKKEHEGAVHLLEAKVRELEEKCRTQSEQFNLLSKELEKFRLQAGKLDILSSSQLTGGDSPGSPTKPLTLSQLLNGLTAPSGKGTVCILKKVMSCPPCSYNPYDGPNEHPEAELPLVAGKYLYVYGTMDEDGFYEGELLDGQQGLVPSNFVDFVQDEELPSLGMSMGLGMDFLGPCSNGTGTLDVNIDEIGEDIVPYPRRITLIKQLAKSVIISWDPPVVLPGWTPISGYNVLVDQEVRMSVPFGGRTKSLIEKLNLASCTHRISIQSMTERGLSDPLRCTLLVGKDVVVAPYYLRVENITQVSAELTWMPSNSNYSHMIFLNDMEYDVVKPGGYKYHFYNLKPMTVYKIRVAARPHQMPWQLPLEQREKKEVSVEFCTQPAGPPLPPQDVQVQMGQTPGVLQIRWKPPPLTPTGTSNGANVIGYIVCTKGQKIAEIMYPTADFVTVELNRIQCLEAREVVVRTISAQGESQDSPVATIPHNLLVPHSHGHPPHPARDPHAKEPDMGRRMGQPWEPHPRAPSPLPPPSHPGHTLEPPHIEGRRSPSPQRILPQPQGVPIPNTVARAMARQAAQRSAPNSRVERRNIFSERGNALHSLNSDEEEDGYDSPHARRRGASVDEFLRGSELGRQHPHYSHSEEYYTESSRGSDLSDIMEEDEEELYSEMQLEEGRRRSINSHNTLKVWNRHPSGRRLWDLQREVVRQRSLRSHKRLHSIPEVAEEEPDTGVEVMGQRLRFEEARPGTPCRSPRPYHQDSRQPNHLSPSKSIRRLQRQRSSPRYSSIEERPPCWSSSSSRQTTKSPDSGLDCGSEEEGSLGYRGSYHMYTGGSPLRVGSGPNMRVIHSEGPVERRALAAGRKRTLTRQCSVEEDFLDAIPETRSMRESYHHYHYHPHHHHPQRRFRSEGRLSEILGSAPSTGRSDRLDHSGHRTSYGCPPAQRRPMTVPSIDGYGGRDRRSPDYYESEPEDLSRIFVAMFDYDPLSMSPNPDAAVEELPFKEGQIIKVFGEKDTDGFYRAEICGRRGLIPCNMVSEIQTDDDEMMDQLLKQGFLPLNTPIEKLERNKRSGRQPPVSTRRMVALYDYDPRESSPNVDVEAELTFCAGDVITVFGEIDEDGFYYGELNGHKGLVPSNFLEEVPDDVEVYLTNTPSRHPQDHPSRTKNKRVPVEKAGPPRRSATPTVRPHIPGSGPAAQGPGSPIRRPRADSKKTGLLSKGKNLLKRLGAVK